MLPLTVLTSTSFLSLAFASCIPLRADIISLATPPITNTFSNRPASTQIVTVEPETPLQEISTLAKIIKLRRQTSYDNGYWTPSSDEWYTPSTTTYHTPGTNDLYTQISDTWHAPSATTAETSTASTESATVSSTTTVTGKAASILSSFGKKAPQCADATEEACPIVFQAIKDAQNSISTPADVCLSLTDNSCPGVCSEGAGPVRWLNWAEVFCTSDAVKNNHTELNFTRDWIDCTAVSNHAYDSLYPWKWRLVRNDTLAAEVADATQAASQRPQEAFRCPSISNKLGSFAIVNIVMLFVDVVLARRDVVKAITFCCRGCHSEDLGRAWIFWALLSVVFNLGANTINAAITKAVPGFGDVSVWELTLLWSSRPRLAWILILFVGIQSDDQIYTSAALSALGAECILQLLGSVYMGRTVDYARRMGFYRIHALKRVPQGIPATVMYAGALLWVVTIGIAFILALIILFIYFVDPDDGHDDLPWLMGILAFLMFVPFLGQWMFWIGFIYMAGDQFCAPEVWKYTNVWSAFSAVAAIFGAV